MANAPGLLQYDEQIISTLEIQFQRIDSHKTRLEDTEMPLQKFIHKPFQPNT